MHIINAVKIILALRLSMESIMEPRFSSLFVFRTENIPNSWLCNCVNLIKTQSNDFNIKLIDNTLCVWGKY